MRIHCNTKNYFKLLTIKISINNIYKKLYILSIKSISIKSKKRARMLTLAESSSIYVTLYLPFLY